jgi:hypothetical protein
MTTDTSNFFSRLLFPAIWVESNLYPVALREGQEAHLKQESPGRVCGSEHYRYGAFCYYVKSPDTTAEQLHLLIVAAAQDPDPVMAQAALIDLVSHPSCTDKLYSEALQAFNKFPEHYFDEEQMNRAYVEKLPSWRL